MTVLVVILTVTALGLAPAAAVGRSLHPAGMIGLGFLYGCGVVYAAMFVLAMFGVPWSLPLIAGIAITVALAASHGAAGASAAVLHGRGRPCLHLLDLATFILLIAYAAFATITAPFNRDFWTIWGMKGRLFFEVRGIDWEFLASPLNLTSHPDYPLLVPFNYSLIAFAGGEWNERWLGLMSVAFGAAAVLVIRALLALETSRHVAAAITFAAASFVLAPQIGLAEGPVIAYGTAGLLMLRRALGANDDALMRHAALLLGLGAVTKNEGVTLLGGAVMGMVAARAPLRRFVALWPAVLLAGSWLIVRAMRHLETDLAAAGGFERALRRLPDLTHLATEMASTISSPWLWIAIVAGLFVARPKDVTFERLILVAVAVQFLVFTAAYLVTPFDASWQVQTSWSRISRQLVAPLLCAVMLALARTFAHGDDVQHAEARSDVS